MATATKVKLSSEMQYLNERLMDGRAVLHSGFSMKQLGNPDPAFQPRVIHLDMGHVNDLDQNFQAHGELHPVVIFHVTEEDRYILVDGFHRHEVYRRAKEAAIPSYVVEGSLQDAMEYAALANQHAILKRSHEDIEKQIHILLSIPQWFEKADAQIAKHVGVKRPTAIRYRASFCLATNTPFPDTCKRSDGKIYPRSLTRKDKRIRKTSDGEFYSHVAGRNVFLGKDLDVAKSRLQERITRIEQRRATLLASDFFSRWLPSRQISMKPSHLSGSSFPNIGQSASGYGRVVITARLDEPSAIYTAIGRLYALREILERPGDRLVMVCVCYPDDGPEALVEVAGRLGVELLTPEEFVASIKGDAGQGDDSPDPEGDNSADD